MTDTIVSIATPSGSAGLGVVRLSGSDAITIADRVFSPLSLHKTLREQAGYTALYGHVTDGGVKLDDCVALVFRAPHSYTGENVVELSCHGGTYLLQRVVRACLDAGARPAEAGEYTRRAFLNGKMDLSGAEAVMALIGAQGELGLRTALATREGAVFRRLTEVKQSLTAVNAAYAAYVDYPDEDIPELETEELRSTLTAACRILEQLLATFDAGRAVREGVDTVIAGAPNVGKSTLMNLLAGYERSIVTDIPGTTRDVVEETIRLGEVTLRLSDTAGLRQTDDRVEQIGVDMAGRRLCAAALTLAVFDGSRPLDENDDRVMEQTAEGARIAIINKSDNIQKINKEYILERYPVTVSLSAKTGEGLDELRRAVEEVTGVHRLDADEPLLATERQRQCVRGCLTQTQDALAALDSGMGLDAVSVAVDGAIGEVLRLTGERVSETVVEEIFSRFCVGK